MMEGEPRESDSSVVMDRRMERRNRISHEERNRKKKRKTRWGCTMIPPLVTVHQWEFLYI